MIRAIQLLAGIAALPVTAAALSQGGAPLIEVRNHSTAQAEARGMAFDVFIRLQNGMSEGELLLRAGKPDSESLESVRHDIVKTFYYMPTHANPWLTAVTLRGGKIVNLERTRKIF